MPKPNPFIAWLNAADLAVTAKRVGVSKTTIREWRTQRKGPNPTRFPRLKVLAERDGFTLTTDDLLLRTAK